MRNPHLKFHGGDGKALQKTVILENKPWLQEWVPATLVFDSGLGTVPWVDYSAIRESHQFGMDAVE